jgi:hypothetical protein
MSDDHLALRKELIDVCRASGASVPTVVQALSDVLLMSLVAIAPDAAAAEHHVRRTSDAMLEVVRTNFAEYQAAKRRQRQ